MFVSIVTILYDTGVSESKGYKKTRKLTEEVSIEYRVYQRLRGREYRIRVIFPFSFTPSS